MIKKVKRREICADHTAVLHAAPARLPLQVNRRLEAEPLLLRRSVASSNHCLIGRRDVGLIRTCRAGCQLFLDLARGPRAVLCVGMLRERKGYPESTQKRNSSIGPVAQPDRAAVS